MKAGTRVRLDNYPSDDAPIGALGTVIGKGEAFIKVQMDDNEHNAAAPGKYALFLESELEVIE